MPSPQSPADAANESVAATPCRPERADKARNRARILAAAAEAFAERGMETQMDDVAARAGLGVGTLYRHFATKDALMVALVERKLERIHEEIRRAIERDDDEPFEIFATTMRNGAELAGADAAAQSALMHAGDGIWAAVEPLTAELEVSTQILVDRAQAAGTMRLDISAADVPMIMCGVSASMGNPKWNWRRNLEILLDGLRSGADTRAGLPPHPHPS